MADVNFFRLKNHVESLKCLAWSAAYLVQEENDDVVRRKLHEYSVLWLQMKADWIKQIPESEEAVHTVNMFRLLEDHELWLRLKLTRVEVTWYRKQYPECDLTQSWVNAFGQIHSNSKEVVDKAMVLLEQTWVFWAGDNTEDLEMGARCAERAVKLVSGSAPLEGLAWFWRFKCEHRLLKLQVQEAMKRAGEEQVMLRKERKGIQGEEEREPEPTPAYPGLELSVQQRLTDMLSRVERILSHDQGWRDTDWLDSRTLSQIMLSAGFHLQLLGHSGLQLFRSVVRLGEEHQVLEETLVAITELIKAGDEVDLDKVLQFGEKLSESKKKGGNNYLAGLAVAAHMKVKGRIKDAATVLNKLLDCEALKLANIIEYNIQSRVKLELSKIKIKVDHEEEEERLRLEGPLELSSDAWKLVNQCLRWLDDTKNEAHRLDPRTLWMLPWSACHQFECLDQLSYLYRTISAPRELKSYIKIGLTFAQEECLALRTGDLLIKLAAANLLCEDEVAAGVQIEGAHFILGDIINSRVDKTKVKNVS